MASSNPSKKRKYLSLDAKVKVIRLNEKGESARRIATELDVGKTQIGNILKMKDSILKEWEAGSNGERKVLHARRALYSDLNDKVYEWCCAVRAKNTPLTGKMLQEKASILSLEMGYDDFTASNGWLHRFQTRHNIKSSVLSGEAADVSQATVEQWAERLQLPPGTSLQDFVNCDNDMQTGCDTEDDLQQAVPSTCIDETEDSENMDDDSEETVAETSHQTPKQAWQHSVHILDFALQQQNTQMLDCIYKLQDLLKEESRKAVNEMKQTRLESFFKQN